MTDRVPVRRSRSTFVAALALGLLAGCGADPPPGTAAPGDPLIARGEALASGRGCASCHSVDAAPGVGPSWAGLAGSSVELADGSTVVADDAYLRRSITDPSSQRVAGFVVSMPQIDLTPAEVDDLVAYIDSLAND